MKQDNLSASLLETVADHERTLTARLAQAKREAERIVQQARAEAEREKEALEKHLEEEAAALRRETDGVCEREMADTKKKSREQLARLRVSAGEESESIVREVIARVLPSGELTHPAEEME